MSTNMFKVTEVVLPTENDDNLTIYGEYVLSVHVEGKLHAIKTGNKIKLKSGNNIYNYGKYKIEDIKTDLELLKSMLNP